MIRFCFLFCLLMTQLNAQSDFVAGEIELNNGKKIVGEIAYNGWFKTPNQITFKYQGEVISYGPEELIGFAIGEDKYLSKKVEINTTKQDAQNLSKTIRSEIENRHIFLKVLVLGNANLYSFKDSRTHFFASKEQKFVELIKLKRSSGSTTSSYNKYLGQLNLLLADCLDELKLGTTQFTATGLTRKIDSYNQCKSGKSSYIAKKGSFEIGLHIIGGYRISSFELSGFYNNYVIDESSTNALTFGLGFDFNILRNTNKLQLFNELLYQSYKFDAAFRDVESDDFFTDYTLNLDIGYLEFSNMLRYQFISTSADFKPFISLGVTNSFKVQDNSTEQAESVFFETIRVTERDPFEGRILSYRVFFSIGAGANFNRLSAEVRYGFNPKFSDFPAVGKSQNVNLLLSYRLL